MSRNLISHDAIVYGKNKFGKNVTVWHFALIRGDNVIGNNVSIGSHSEIAHHVIIEDDVKIHSGCFVPEYTILRKGCWIGPRVVFVNDPYPQTGGKHRKGVEVGTGAIIGANSTIMAGVIIGKCAIIGAGSVVTKDVPSYQIYAGNPASFMKNREELDEYTIG